MSQVKQRITVVIPKASESEFHDILQFTDEALLLPQFEYQRQDRFTIPFQHIPQDWKAFIARCDSIRLEMTSPESYDHSIFGDYPQSGFNFNYKPVMGADRGAHTDILKSAADILTRSTRSRVGHNAFIITPTSVKYHSDAIEASSLEGLLSHLLKSRPIQPGWKYLQVYYDASKSENLIVEVYWDSYNYSENFLLSDSIQKEIGVFSIDDKLTNVENIGLNGVRFLFSGPKIEAKKTSFQFTPRQRLVPNVTFTSFVIEPHGLHPVYKLQIESEEKMSPPILVSGSEEIADVDICKLFCVWDIPKDFFIDRYQIHDSKFEEQGINLIGLFGDSNLELPNYMMKNWGAEAFFELNPSIATSFEIPFHSRYAMPSNDEYFNGTLHRPLLFWGCDLHLPISILEQLGNVDGGKNIYQREISEFEANLQVLSLSPFHHKFLDYESFFDENTVFYHIPGQGEGESTVTIPVAKREDNDKVQLYSLVVIFLSFIYLLRKLFK